MATRRQVFWRVTFVLQVLVLAALALLTWSGHRWVATFLLCCLVGSLTPLGAVWSTWRQRRETARPGLPGPE